MAANISCSLLALSVISGSYLEWLLSGHSGHCSALALNGSVAIDPKRTFGIKNLPKAAAPEGIGRTRTALVHRMIALQPRLEAVK
jgi:hypothetical protein